MTLGQHIENGAHFAFTDRWGGVSAVPYEELNLGGAVGDDPTAVLANRAIAAEQLGIGPDRVVWMNQVHGRDVAVVPGPWGAAADIPAVDAVVTAHRGLALAVLTADCTPVLLADPVAGVAGAAHAGRPGLVAGVVPAAVEAMVSSGPNPGGSSPGPAPRSAGAATKYRPRCGTRSPKRCRPPTGRRVGGHRPSTWSPGCTPSSRRRGW